MAPPPPATTTAAATANHPNPTRLRRSPEDRGAGKKQEPQRSASFHGRTAPATSDQRGIRRPKTQPDLLAAGWRKAAGGLSPPEPRRDGGDDGARRVPAKVLVNVAVQRSLGPIQVMASTEWSMGDLVAAAVRQYVKEGRRPPLPTAEPSDFGLHYSQFSLECLDPKEKLIGLGSRNFFLCPNSISASSAAGTAASSSSSCSKEAEKGSKISIAWLKFMDFLM